MRRRALLAGLGGALAAPGGPARAEAMPPSLATSLATSLGPRVSIADLGARPDGSDAAPFLRAALARLPRRGGAVLHIPPGTWRVAQTDGTALGVSGFDDLLIEGSGALLLFRGRARPFAFSGCRAPAVRGLAVDWERPPFSQGEVASVGAGGRAAEIRVDPAFPVDGSEAVAALGTYDRETGLTARGGVDAYDAVERVALAADQRLALAFNRPLPLRPGDTVVMRHLIYAASALSFARCTDVLVEDVAVHGAPGMAVVADHCRGATVRRLRVAPPAGSGRLMSTTADGAHFSACAGRVLVEDCAMAAMGDDGVNVHGKYFRIVRRVDARTTVVAASPGALAGPDRPAPDGDAVEWVAASTLETRGEAVVAAAEAQGDLTVLHLDRDLPAGVGPGDYMFDAETRARATVSRCRFEGNRARGVLAHSDAAIEGCAFSGQSGEAVLLLPDARFMEGPAAERVVVHGNEIAGTLRRGGRPSGAIRIGAAPGVPGGALSLGRPVNRDVAVTGNRVADPGGAAVLARSCAGLRIEGNRIERPAGPAVALEAVRDVRVAGNVCAPASPVSAGPLDREQLVLAGNTGLIAPP